eukprot:16452391-Heterocapsa_arctica.AAC.2
MQQLLVPDLEVHVGIGAVRGDHLDPVVIAGGRLRSGPVEVDDVECARDRVLDPREDDALRSGGASVDPRAAEVDDESPLHDAVCARLQDESHAADGAVGPKLGCLCLGDHDAVPCSEHAVDLDGRLRRVLLDGLVVGQLASLKREVEGPGEAIVRFARRDRGENAASRDRELDAERHTSRAPISERLLGVSCYS